MSTTGRVMFDALEQLVADEEFARSIELHEKGAEYVVAYLVRRGVGQTEAQLLGMAYYAGRVHACDRVDLTLKRLGLPT